MPVRKKVPISYLSHLFYVLKCAISDHFQIKKTQNSRIPFTYQLRLQKGTLFIPVWLKRFMVDYKEYNVEIDKWSVYGE